MSSFNLIIYLKVPISGFVKTRLAQSIGEQNALDTYTLLAEAQLDKICSQDSIEVHFTPETELTRMIEWLSSDYNYHPQIEGGLGDKLIHSIESSFERKQAPCICIGADCPELNETHIKETLRALETGADVVFGPCTDGGYYLVGLNKPQPELFRDIPWSSDDTLAVSVKKAQQLGLKIHFLETLYDVDNIHTLKRAIDEGHLPKHLLPSGHTQSDLR